MQSGLKEQDIAHCLAGRHQPGPYTRIGPGINGAIKPELLADGGNLVFQGYGETRRIATDPGCAVLSLSHEPQRQLFAYQSGTSFAAPYVARLAALLWHQLKVAG